MAETITQLTTRGMTCLAVSRTTCGDVASVAWRVMRRTAGRMTQQTTPVITCTAADRMPCETTDEGFRRVTSETAPQTMAETTSPTKDQTTVQTTSQTIRWVIPQVGVSVSPYQA